MSAIPRPTIRSLARELNISRTSVSEALRDLPRVNIETRRRVQAAAANAGYRLNPLATSILSELRRARSVAFHGVLAVVSLDEPLGPRPTDAYRRELLRGASDRAEELGFKLERFLVGERGVSIHRLDTILQSRGIRGVLILPAWRRPDFSHLDWRNYSGVYADYLIDAPALHSVCPDHSRAMSTALSHLRALGYRQPGLVLQEQESGRIEHRWAGAFLAFVHVRKEFVEIPPLVASDMTEAAFTPWFRRYRPDVVVGHRAEILDWMKACGADVPRTRGFCCLNVSMNATPCAGIDQQPYHVGVRGIETVVSQLHRNEYGIPDVPCNLTVPSRWADGPTLRRQAGVRCRKRRQASAK